MDINQAFPSRFVKALELGNRELTLTIREIKMETVVKGRKVPVAYFDGCRKGVVLNKTNARFMATLFQSDETDHWIGREVVLYRDMVEFGDKMVPSIRVKAPQLRAVSRA